MTPEEYAALKALVDELLALTKGGDDLSGVVIPDDFKLEDAEGKAVDAPTKGQYIAEIVNQLMKANEERDAAWGVMQDSQTATKALARVSGGDGAVANPYANKGQLLGVMPESLGKRFAQSAEMKTFQKVKGYGNHRFVHEMGDDVEFAKFIGDGMGLKANVATYGGPFLPQDIAVFPILPRLSPLDLMRIKPVSTDRAYFQTYTRSGVAADSIARGADLPLFTIDAASTSLLIQNVGGVQRVSRNAMQDEMEAQNIIDRLVRYEVRKELQRQAFRGTGGTNDGDDIYGILDTLTAVAMIAADNAHEELTVDCETLRESGATPNAIFVTAANWGQLWGIIGAAGFAFNNPVATQAGMMMIGGVPVISTSDLTANNAIIHSQEGYCLAMRMDVEVMISEDSRFRQNQVEVRAIVRVQGHVEQEDALVERSAVGTAAGTY